jgi:protein-tyrosine phosphatase
MVDLRTPAEVERYPAPVDRLRTRLLHLPFPPSSTGDEGREGEMPELSVAYRFIADLSGPSINQLFATLADHDNLPAVLFCAAGKDRTGVAIALVLGALGVTHEQIADDYSRTGRFDPKSIGSDYAARYEFLPDSYRDSRPETMLAVLDGLTKDHGSIRAFVKGTGVDESTLKELESRLIG